MEMISNFLAGRDLSDFDHTILGVIYLTIGILGISCHLLLVIVFGYSPGLVTSPRNLLHVSIAVANIGVIMGFPLVAASSFMGKWQFGDLGCQIYAFEGMLCGVASVWCLALLAVERYLANCRPLFYAQLTLGHYVLALIYVWCKAAVSAVFPLAGWSRYAFEPTGLCCTLDWGHPDDSYRSYIISLSAVCYIIPFSIIAFCLIRVRSVGSVNKIKKISVSKLKAAVKNGGELNEADAVKICTVLSLVSLITWMPYALICLNSLVNDPNDLPYFLTLVPSLVTKVMTSLVPFAYIMSSTRVRHAVWSVLGFRSLNDNKES